MLKKEIAISIFIFLTITSFSNFSWGQLLQWNTFGNAGTETTEPSVFNNTNISSSNLTFGAGVSAAANGNRFGGNNWFDTGDGTSPSEASAISGNDYIQFIVTPNGGCSFTPTSFTFSWQSSATGPGMVSLRSSADGFATSLGTQAVTQTITSYTINISGISNVSSALTFRLYGYGNAGSNAAAGGTGGFDVSSSVVNVQLNGSTSCGSSNTITTGAVSGTPFSVTCSTTDNGTVAFTSTGTFTARKIYTAQLSDASGSFSSPINIGTLSSTANSGSINITIPSQTATGSGYRIRVISSSPNTVGSNSSTFSINLTGGPCASIPPHITSIIYDGCAGGSCSNEGQSEIVFANSGSYNILVNGSNLNLDYTIGTPYDLIGTVVNMSATTTAMNTAAGCSGTYVNGFGSTIPPNSSILLVPSDICTAVFSWDALCGQGPIYVIYGQSGTSGDTWRTGGNFGNTSGSKTFDLQITATNGTTYSTSYSYNAPSSGTNGNYATYSSDPPGGSSVTQGNFPNCQITTTVLASDLIFFSGYEFNRRNQLIWKTSSEQNNSHFTISRSVDGINYDVVTTISGAGTTDLPQEYQWEDVENNTGVNYYKLRSFDFDGTMHEKGIVSIKSMQDIPYFNSITSTIEFPTKSDISIYNLGGQLIINSFYEKSIAFDQHGLFLLHDNNSGETFRLFIQQ